MKKFISLLLVTILLLSAVMPAFAEDQTMVITIDKALELAKENSLVLNNHDNNILIAERNLKTALRKSDDVETKGIVDDNTLLENGKIKDLYPAQKQRILDDLLTDKEDAIRDIEIEVTSTYYSLYNETLSIESMKANLEVQKQELISKQKELELGLTTKNAVLDFENTIAQTELNIQKANWSIEMAQMNLAKLLGVNLNTRFFLVEKLDLSTVVDIDVTALSEIAKTEGASIKKAEKDLEMLILEEKVMNRYSRFYSSNLTDDYDERIVDLEKAVEDAKISEELKIRSDYNSILTAQLDLEISKLKLEITERTLNTNQVKNDLGMVIYLEVVKAQNTVDEAKIIIQTEELNLYKLVENFNYYTKDFVTE